MKITIAFFLLFFVSMNCYSQTAITTDSTYIKEIQQWHTNRETSLKSENGWLNLAGLLWLNEGENTFGSSKTNNIVFPANKADEQMGTLILKDSAVTLKVALGCTILSNNTPIKEGIIYEAKWEHPMVLSHRKLKWFIIKRGNRYAIRLRDLESETLKNFTTIDYFPIDSKWKIVAKLVAPEHPTTIPVHDVIGLTTATPFGGTLYFEINGKPYKLGATQEESDDLFIVFSDATTGNETYGGGRFLYAKKPSSGDEVILDFNKAYNPPCCFTPFATCPLPPAQNRLDIPINAGEKTFGHH